MERYGKAKTAKFMVNFSASRDDSMTGRKPEKRWSASVGAGKKAEAPIQKIEKVRLQYTPVWTTALYTP